MVKPIGQNKLLLVFLSILLVLFISPLALCDVIAQYNNPTAAVVYFHNDKPESRTPFFDLDYGEWWKQRLEKKLADPSWPVNLTLEMVYMDATNNVVVPASLKSWMAKRMANTSLPPVSCVIYDYGYEGPSVFEDEKIPTLVAIQPSNALSPEAGLGPNAKYKFMMSRPIHFRFQVVATKFLEVGIKSVVLWINVFDALQIYGIADNDYSISYQSCYRGANQYMVPRDIEIMETFTYNFALGDDLNSIKHMIETTRTLNPDAVLFCDILGPFIAPWFYMHPLKVMKDLDYTPKAFAQISTRGTDVVSNYLVPNKLLPYVIEPVYSHPKLSGDDYTEDAGSYASEFRDFVPETVAEEVLAGSNLPGYPSSAYIFNNYTTELLGFPPSDYGYSTWATFDVIEQAAYKLASMDVIRAKGAITGNDMYGALLNSQCRTVAGRVAFNHNNVNYGMKPSLMQYLDAAANNEIVSPSEVRTHPFVYPMPTWKEREYSWSIIESNTMKCVALGAVLSSMLFIIMITIVIHRNEMDIRMLYMPHLLLMLWASLLFYWTLVFVWQSDMNQTQCDVQLWLIYLPASFIIQLTNMKAYRLSVFLTSDNKSRRKRLTHNRILLLTLAWVSFTGLLLLIAQLADPPTSTKVVVDVYRPSKDYHVCRNNGLTTGILYFLVIFHMLFSIYCVAAVRNGSEAFKDGLIMKEAFVLLFGCISIAYIFAQLNLSQETFYFLRNVFLGIGMILFNTRLLLSRCLKHWIPQALAILLLRLYSHVKRVWPATSSSANNTDAKVSALELCSIDGTDNKNQTDVLGSFGPGDNQIDDMMTVIRDENRSKIFKALAEKLILTENVMFLEDVDSLPNKYKAAIIESSSVFAKEMKKIADEIHEKYCREGSAYEVNIPSNMRVSIEKRLAMWKDEVTVSELVAEEIVKEDLLKIDSLFRPASIEIARMLYMNIWNKFLTAETEICMGSTQV